MDLVEKRKYHRNVMEVIDVSDEEIDYDSYLDQLDDDEVPISATITSSLALSSLLQDSLPKLGGEELDPFSEDFPVINRASAPEISSGGGSLMALVGAEAVKEPEAVRKRMCSLDMLVVMRRSTYHTCTCISIFTIDPRGL